MYTIHIVVLIISIFLFIISIFTDLEYIFGQFSYGLSYGLFAWGIIGILGAGEPLSFFMGLLVYVLIVGIYNMLISKGVDLSELVLKEGKVTVPIPVEENKKGEIMINVGNTNKFFIAAPYETITKPIPKGTKVRVISVKDNVVYVGNDIIIPRRDIRFKDRFYSFIDKITPKTRVSGTCCICFSNLINSTNAVRCPKCGAVAHEDHMRTWLNIKGICPNCRAPLEFEGKHLKAVETSIH